jgi:hypothetical protein
VITASLTVTPSIAIPVSFCVAVVAAGVVEHPLIRKKTRTACNNVIVFILLSPFANAYGLASSGARLPAPIGSQKYFMFFTITRNIIPENNINEMIETTPSVFVFLSLRKYNRA